MRISRLYLQIKQIAMKTQTKKNFNNSKQNYITTIHHYFTQMHHLSSPTLCELHHSNKHTQRFHFHLYIPLQNKTTTATTLPNQNTIFSKNLHISQQKIPCSAPTSTQSFLPKKKFKQP